MLGDRLLLLALALAVSMATNDLPFCSRSFTPKEWQKEGESYLLNIKELEQHLQPEPQLISKINNLATGKPQPFLELIYTAVWKVVPLNGFYLSICTLIAGLMLTFYILRKKHLLSQIEFFSLLMSDKARTIKYMKICILLLLALMVVFSLKGMKEGVRQEKAINHILCRMVASQQVFQKNNTYVTHSQMQNYAYQIAFKLNADHFEQTMDLQKRLRYAEYPQKNIQVLIRTLQAESYQGSLLQQLLSANETLHYLSKFMLRAQDFENKCRRKILSFPFELLKLSSVSDIFRDLRSNRIKDVSLNNLPENAAMIGKVFFLVVLIMAVVAGFLILIKEERQYKQPCLDWLRFAILMIAILCFVTVLLTTLFLSFNLWAYRAEQQIIRDPYLCYEQFQQYSELCRLLVPSSKNAAKTVNVSPFTPQACKNYSDQFDHMVRPYFAKNETYFYDLMVGSAKEIRSSGAKSEIMERIETRNAKVTLLPIMKGMSDHLAFFLKVQEDIQAQNINFTVFFEGIVKLLAAHTSNSAYSIRYICQNLSIILGLILFLFSVIKWLAESQQNNGHKLSSQSEASTQLAEVDQGTQIE